MSTWQISKVYQWLNFVQFWLLPPTCVLCSKPAKAQLDLCQHCLDSCLVVENPCPSCGLPLPTSAQALLCGHCLQSQRDIHSTIHTTVSAFAYQQPVSSLITQFKYHRQLAAGRALSSLLACAIQDRYQLQPLPDLLLPIPLHAARLRQRGYNQADLMARDLSKALQIPTNNRLLTRIRTTPTQQGLSAAQRKSNLRAAFAVTEPMALQQYQRIALVDDVVTTMSTVREVAATLRKVSPLVEVHVWCLARA
jgi:ComF family protein